MCKYGLLYLVAFAIPVLRVQLRFVDCINKRKKEEEQQREIEVGDLDVMVGLKAVQLVQKFQHCSLDLTIASFLTIEPLGT